MDFQRIDENTVQCRMTEEEMNSYGFAIEDFFTNQERSREFLESIVEMAEEEIDSTRACRQIYECNK